MSTIARPVPRPSLIRVQREPKGDWDSPVHAGAVVTCRSVGSGLSVQVAAADGLSRVHLRWLRELVPATRVFGEGWERSYGDLAWRSCSLAERLHPWMVLLHSQEATWGAGVAVRAGAFAGWTVDPEGVSLWLDVRAGGEAVVLGERELQAATVHWVSGDDGAFRAQCVLAEALCSDPLLPHGPLAGISSVGRAGAEAAAVLRDVRTIADLVGDHPVRPYAVVGDGWSLDGGAAVRQGSGVGDLAEVAARIAEEAVRPGLSMRPLLARERPLAGSSRSWSGGWALDPSHPTTLERVGDDIRTIRQSGFELINFDYTSFDSLGRWGFQMGPRPAGEDIHPYDRSRTTAEVLVDLYRTIHLAAGDAVVLGSNVVGHLAAGLIQAQRIGAHNSGRVWDRTRRIGVNALAFRIALHRRFFAVDAGYVPITTEVSWVENRQFLDLIARSGTSLFVGVDPASRSPEVDADLSAALQLALDGGTPGGVEPLDWMESTTPQKWRVGGGAVTYDWFPEAGADPFDVNDVIRPLSAVLTEVTL